MNSIIPSADTAHSAAQTAGMVGSPVAGTTFWTGAAVGSEGFAVLCAVTDWVGAGVAGAGRVQSLVKTMFVPPRGSVTVRVSTASGVPPFRVTVVS